MIVLDNAIGGSVGFESTLPIDTRKRIDSQHQLTPGVHRHNVIAQHVLSADAPPMLTPLASCVAAVPHAWWVIETQSKYEKSLAWKLLEKQLPYYLPLVMREKMISGVRRRNVVPLFDNYIFVASDAGLQFCRESRCVLNILAVTMQKRLVNELSSLEIALFANPRLEVCDIDTVGQRVRVTGGRMEGIEGEIENFYESKGMVRVIVKIEMLGKGTQFDVDRSDLELIQ